MSMNLSDTTILYLLRGNRAKIYKQILEDSASGKSGLATEKELRKQKQDLTDLIDENADEIDAVSESVGALEHDMETNYLAIADLDPSVAPQFGLTWDEDTSDFVSATGIHYESIAAKIRADAESISEAFTSESSAILSGEIANLGLSVLEMAELFNGEIRRGYIDVVEDGATRRYFGIAITSRDIFTTVKKRLDLNGVEVASGGDEYYEIDTGQCFGLYTATGWQFWVGNKKLGWFDTSDGQLHVTSINIEDDLQMGNWILIEDGQFFGIKYIG